MRIIRVDGVVPTVGRWEVEFTALAVAAGREWEVMGPGSPGWVKVGANVPGTDVRLVVAFDTREETPAGAAASLTALESVVASLHAEPGGTEVGDTSLEDEFESLRHALERAAADPARAGYWLRSARESVAAVASWLEARGVRTTVPEE